MGSSRDTFLFINKKRLLVAKGAFMKDGIFVGVSRVYFEVYLYFRDGINVLRCKIHKLFINNRATTVFSQDAIGDYKVCLRDIDLLELNRNIFYFIESMF